MKYISDTQIKDLRTAFVGNLSVDFFDDEEIDYVLGEIDSFEQPARQKVQALLLALSSASSSLVPRVLSHIRNAAGLLPVDDLDHWVSKAFDLLDSQGIDQALAFLGKTSGAELAAFVAPKGVPFRDAAPMLETFVRGLSGLDLKVASDQDQYTDTVTIFFPSLVKRFPEQAKNILLYKLSGAYAWAQIAQGTLTLNVDVSALTQRFKDYSLDYPDIDAFLSLFPEQDLAKDLYTINEAFRLTPFLTRELPGLMKQAEAILPALIEDRPELDGLSEKTAFVEAFYQHFLRKRTRGVPPAVFADYMRKLHFPATGAGIEEAIDVFMSLYREAASLDGAYEPRQPLPFFGKIQPQKVSLTLRELRQARLRKLEVLVTKLIDLPDTGPRERSFPKKAIEKRLIAPEKEYLLIRGRLVELDDELKEIIEKRGGVPGGILVKGSEMGGGSPVNLTDLIEEEEVIETEGGTKYDEWDYKRGGYKKDWCSLYEHDIHPGHEPVVEMTLTRYSGYVNVLRKKFELLKREPRTQRRRKDGDDIDIDAVIEAFSDQRAGISPTENLFTRLDRSERNIAVLFLVDMSGSTKGWVNEAEKESLVLMAEALEALGDRYAVYGFSGMTRNRCDLYRVKGFDEPYAESVKRRIAGIEPKDYTRMGPFIRHAAKLLASVAARTKLLITLSDGKPEDWDAYKGDYGIEDTRKALLEAREQGIHPFCITIDKEAQSYLPHMYGEVNYIFIDDVRKLPNRITEIYRRLTS
jgi:nitric oxide reductase NorD protein